MDTIKHRLPSDPPEWGDAQWFLRLNSFEQAETVRQVRFKRKQWPDLPDGRWSGNRRYAYPHILPEAQAHLSVYPTARDALLAYVSESDIALHKEFANLRSSQVCCLNFLFPLRERLGQAAQPLAPLLPGVAQVQAMEFEYTGPRGATEWLGEPPGGKRGANRTSADAAIWWTDAKSQRRLTLVEWKYTERGFGDCGGYWSKGNGHKEACDRWHYGATRAERRCYLEAGTSPHVQRHYWERLAESGIGLDAYEAKPCPFRGPLYQLTRLHLLATFLEQQGEATRADVAVVHFHQNAALGTPPAELQHLGSDVIDVWRRLLEMPESIRTCSAEDLAGAVRAASGDEGHAAYLAERYGV